MTHIYMNNAATSWPKPADVASAVKRAVSELPGAGNRGGLSDFDVLAKTRTHLATVMGVSDANRIALGANATWALNAAIFGLNLGAGDYVLTTAAEHNSVLRPLYHLNQHRAVNIIYLPVDNVGRVSLDVWQQAAMQFKPRLCVVTHASNVTGAVNDVAALAQIAHSVGAVFLLDAAQTLGWLPCEFASWSVDMAAFTGHKYLLGPQGTGGLYLREGINLLPHLLGGTGIHSDLETMPEQMPLHLEAGTGNEPGYHGLLAALAWAEVNPIKAAATTTTRLLARLKDGLTTLGAKIVSCDDATFTPVLSFTLKDYPADALGAELLENYGIIVRTGLHCAPKVFDYLGVDPKLGTVRVSLSRFSSEDDISSLLDALSEIVAAGPEWL
jgi:selenocysteine lyase/cysteine desulfurase